MTDFVQIDLRYRRLFFSLLIVVFIMLSAKHGLSQDTDDVVRIDTDLVSFEVTVTDKQGRLVPNLKQEDFRLLEDGVERPIEFFQPLKKSNEGRPLSVVFALDVSGSMTEAEIGRLRSAMQTFIGR